MHTGACIKQQSMFCWIVIAHSQNLTCSISAYQVNSLLFMSKNLTDRCCWLFLSVDTPALLAETNAQKYIVNAHGSTSEQARYKSLPFVRAVRYDAICIYPCGGTVQWQYIFSGMVISVILTYVKHVFSSFDVVIYSSRIFLQCSEL